MKSGEAALLHFGEQVEEILQALPKSGPLFPYLAQVRVGDRATEFKQRCVGLGIASTGFVNQVVYLDHESEPQDYRSRT